MECPKCHRNISDKIAVCPHCHKVLALECQNCHTLNQTPVCEKCGFTILIKCSKCGKLVPSTNEQCKCGFPVKSSIAYQECETDEFAAVTIKFLSLKSIRRLLASQELYAKFNIKLKNLLNTQLKKHEGKIVIYNDTYVVNFNKELSFPTSVNKACRLALKLINTFTDLNLKVMEELGTSLNLNITISKKASENLLENIEVENKVKLLTSKKSDKRYLKGMQVILDQYSRDCIEKEYKTDSLYSVENDGISTMFYEILLENYILPPAEKLQEENTVNAAISKINKKQEQEEEVEDLYGFKIFNIDAKCKFEKATASNILDKLDDSKIISLRGEKEHQINLHELRKYYELKGQHVISAVCTKECNYKPWGIFEQLFRDYYKLSLHNSLISEEFNIKRFAHIKELIFERPRKSATAEDARFGYMEDFGNFLASLKDCVIIIDGFENIDDTSLQTLELYFDRFKKVNATFVFITNIETALHSKLKELLRTKIYTEILMLKNDISSVISTIKEDASDFISSFYYEKICENFHGSKIYFDNAILYLEEKGIISKFENKLILRSNSSVILPKDINGLIKSRLKLMSKEVDASMMLAYSVFLGPRIDFGVFEKLEIKDVRRAAGILEAKGFVSIKDEVVYFNNYNILKSAIETSLKKEIQEFLCKTIFAKLAKGFDITTTLLIMGRLSMFKEEYLLLWKNSQFAMAVGDYDAYLKNCLGFLSLVDYIKENIPEEEIENNKKDVYQNILMSLYNYSPSKIYSIENILLTDAINENDNDKIVKLSNLMLQGALISANYTDALSLLHNILTRMPAPTLIVDGAINAKFLLLSLVNIEILFNIGDFAECVTIAEEILDVIKLDILEKLKPSNFSLNLFVEHILDTFRLVGFAKLFLMQDDLEEFFDKVKTIFNTEFEDKNCILSIKEFLKGKDYIPSKTEESSPFAKIIYLILQEFTEHSNNYKEFAQNIYKAKLLASDLKETQLELFCDLLIGYAYAKMGVSKKANAIYNDVLEKSVFSAIFNIQATAKYFMAKLYISQNDTEAALLSINDALALLQKHENKIFFVLFEKLLIELLKSEEIKVIDLTSEEQKLEMATANGDLNRLL